MNPDSPWNLFIFQGAHMEKVSSFIYITQFELTAVGGAQHYWLQDLYSVISSATHFCDLEEVT